VSLIAWHRPLRDRPCAHYWLVSGPHSAPTDTAQLYSLAGWIGTSTRPKHYTRHRQRRQSTTAASAHNRTHANIESHQSEPASIEEQRGQTRPHQEDHRPAVPFAAVLLHQRPFTAVLLHQSQPPDGMKTSSPNNTTQWYFVRFVTK
jgi:hypothetical protein